MNIVSLPFFSSITNFLAEFKLNNEKRHKTLFFVVVSRNQNMHTRCCAQNPHARIYRISTNFDNKKKKFYPSKQSKDGIHCSRFFFLYFDSKNERAKTLAIRFNQNKNKNKLMLILKLYTHTLISLDEFLNEITLFSNGPSWNSRNFFLFVFKIKNIHFFVC